jgi:hypothetical protein
MLFTTETLDEIVERCHTRLGRESLRILMDMDKPIRTDRSKIPVVAIGADGDEMVATRMEVVATAKARGTKPIQVPGGHDLMLDTYWEQAAGAIETAIAEHVPSLVVAT